MIVLVADVLLVVLENGLTVLAALDMLVVLNVVLVLVIWPRWTWSQSCLLWQSEW